MAKYNSKGDLRASQSNPLLQAQGMEIPSASTTSKGIDVDQAYKNLSIEEQKQLKKLLDVKEPGASQVAFKFNKNLHHGGKYSEVLDGSDDEDAFDSIPRTRDGQVYDLDFKLDAFRDEI